MHAEYLGARQAETLIVVVGRNNLAKTSEPITAILHKLHEWGASICWLDTKARFYGRQRLAAYAQIRQQWLDPLCERQPLIGSVLRRLVRLYLKLKYPKRHGRFFSRYQAELTENDLLRFLRRQPNQHVHLLTHSAGGILATQVANQACVKKIICFGYPFKHPERQDEAYRTAHLKDVRKPTLIIQGTQDEYGSSEDARRYASSPHIALHALESDHDFADLTSSDIAGLTDLIIDFMQRSQ